MPWLCVIKWTVVGVVWGFSVSLAYGWGQWRANRRYWKMLEKAGSRTRGY